MSENLNQASLFAIYPGYTNFAVVNEDELKHYLGWDILEESDSGEDRVSNIATIDDYNADPWGDGVRYKKFLIGKKRDAALDELAKKVANREAKIIELEQVLENNRQIIKEFEYSYGRERHEVDRLRKLLSEAESERNALRKELADRTIISGDTVDASPKIRKLDLDD